ncbi:uncharacterized protein LTR77_005257 [Saxophila tyrrhenica]|uniref:Uncharacterized protein n=1 Tax=Saxophila tyrrhenica TaxID=1690608 RepID=A0AAV9PBI0_9PEZI|nr:hypothetical protein LTR77_005257 [Saxophila tyrrhenica]
MLPNTSVAYAPLSACLQQRFRRLNSGVCQLEANYLATGKSFFALPALSSDAFDHFWTTDDSRFARFVKLFWTAEGAEGPEFCLNLTRLLTLRDEISQALKHDDLSSAETKLDVLEEKGEIQDLEVQRAISDIDRLYLEKVGEERPSNYPVTLQLALLEGDELDFFKQWLSAVPEIKKSVELGIATFDELVFDARHKVEDSVVFGGDDEETLYPPTPVEERSGSHAPTDNSELFGR